MANKLLSFLGLADSGDVVVESHRNKRRRTDYMKKIQRLVVPDDEEETEVPAAGNEAAPAAVEDERAFAAAADAVKENGESEEAAEFESDGGRQATGFSGSFSSRLRRFGESLRRQDDTAQPLVLVKKGAAAMLDDIEDALVQGQTVMLDFEKEDRKAAADIVRRVADFVRMHDGAFYTVTSTSLLLSLNKNSVIEWLPEGNGQER